jgi:hypothetical protein
LCAGFIRIFHPKNCISRIFFLGFTSDEVPEGKLAGEVILRLQGELNGFASDDLAYALDDAIDNTDGRLVVT